MASYEEPHSTIFSQLMPTKDAGGDDIPCQIEEGLYLGSVRAANNKTALKNLNITHVLVVAYSLPPAFPGDFVYKTIPVPDLSEVNITQYFGECYTFIEEAKRSGGGVLVHCIAGISRSATIVVAYLMIKHNMRLSEAMEHVKQKRPSVSPNFGFLSQLENFDKSIQDRWGRFKFKISMTKARILEVIRHREK